MGEDTGWKSLFPRCFLRQGAPALRRTHTHLIPHLIHTPSPTHRPRSFSPSCFSLSFPEEQPLPFAPEHTPNTHLTHSQAAQLVPQLLQLVVRDQRALVEGGQPRVSLEEGPGERKLLERGDFFGAVTRPTLGALGMSSVGRLSFCTGLLLEGPRHGNFASGTHRAPVP